MASYLEQLLNQHPALAEALTPVHDLHGRKLWHQLTGAIEELFENPTFCQAVPLLEFYNGFIKGFEMKLKPLRVCLLAVTAAKQQMSAKNMAAARDFLTDVLERVKDPHASLVLKSSLARIFVSMEDTKQAKEIVEANIAYVDKTSGLDNQVYSAIYQAAAEFHKVQGNADEFYKMALLFLAYTAPGSIHNADQIVIAFDIGIAALLGENIFNFGELLQHPLIRSLDTTEHKWLGQLLDAFNHGDISKYDAVSSQYQTQMKQQPSLVAKATMLNEKIRIMALIDMVFKCPADQRAIPFQAIADHTRVPLDQVELLVMRTLSLKLLKGSMDQVEGVFRVTWVQPRVLDVNQAAVLKSKLANWATSLEGTTKFLEAEIPA